MNSFFKSTVALTTSLCLAGGALAAPVASAFQAAPKTTQSTPSVLDLNLPSLGTTADSSLSPSQERALGANLMTKVRTDPTYVSDPVLSEYLNKLGYKLVSSAKTYTYQFFFFAIRDATLNAFALPGGYIAIHTGTIIAARNESELAGVLGHEIGHVSQRHIARMIESQRSNLPITIGSILLAILVARAGGNSGGHAAAAIAMGSQAAMIQSMLNYSQDAEREADRIGLQTLYNAGFNPEGMQGFFERLQAKNRLYESAAPAYLSTHPLTLDRLSDMEARTKQLPHQAHQDSLDFSLVQVRARVIQQNTHDGWLKEKAELERQLKDAKGQKALVLHYGLSVVNSFLNLPEEAYREAEFTRALGPNPIVAQNLSLTRFQAAKSASEKEAALAQAKADLSRYPLSSMMTENYVDLLYRLDRHETLIKFLENNLPQDSSSDFHAMLARSYEKLGKRSEQYRHTGEMYALLGDPEAAEYQYALAQKAADADFYTMSVIDARLRELRAQVIELKKEKNR